MRSWMLDRESEGNLMGIVRIQARTIGWAWLVEALDAGVRR